MTPNCDLASTTMHRSQSNIELYYVFWHTMQFRRRARAMRASRCAGFYYYYCYYYGDRSRTLDETIVVDELQLFLL